MAKKRAGWEDYYSTLKRIPRRLKQTAQFIVDALPELKQRGVKRVVDVGCGAGRHSVLLANNGFEVVGIDVSKSALKLARRWTEAERLENVMLVRAAMTRVPLTSRCSDAVVSVSVLHHAVKKDIQTAVNEVHRILRSNGLFLANLASAKDPRFRKGRKAEKNTYWLPEAYEEERFEELHHFFTRSEALSLLNPFAEKRVIATKEKPYYLKVRAAN